MTPVTETATGLLSRFTNPSQPVTKNVVLMDAYRGDCTETGERRLKAMLGDAAYESLHYDTLACDGRIVVIIPRCKWEGATPAPCGWRIMTAEHYWALGQIDERHPDVMPATPATISRVSDQDREKLNQLPGLQFVDVKVVHYWEHGNGKPKRKKKPAPQDVIYFRFDGGYGVVAPKPSTQ